MIIWRQSFLLWYTLHTCDVCVRPHATPDTDRPGSRLCARFFIFTVYLVCRSLVLVALSVEAIDQSPQSQDRCK